MPDPSPEKPVPPELSELVAGRFAALGDPMRIRLVDALRSREEASVQELAVALEAGHANVSKHLGVLHAQRIVARRKAGTRVMYRIADASVLELCDQVSGAIHDQLRELVELVGPQPGPPPPAPAGTTGRAALAEAGTRPREAHR
jgi:DNA-binding transcriptional ArsR family regulator